MIDLKQYCADEDYPVAFVRRPFSIGDRTYAMNGHFAVRVPLRDDAPKLDARHVAKIVEIFEKPPAFPLAPLPVIDMPEKKMIVCAQCKGRGDCECFECEQMRDCPACDGFGEVDADREYAVWLGEAMIALRYWRLLAALPDLKIFIPTEPERGPIYFTFAGGDGLVMPMRYRKQSIATMTMLGVDPASFTGSPTLNEGETK